MKITTILYDLDGTLLSMDMDRFMKAYFGRLSLKMKDYGFEPQTLIDAVWSGTKAMVKNNDGVSTAEDAFWKDFKSIFGEEVYNHKETFEDFYHNEFCLAREVVEPNPLIPALIKEVKALGLKQVLATNPLFPNIATEERMKWAELDLADFEFFTSYEDSHYCKPNLNYYKEVLERAGVCAEECIMVGNDVDEDMIAAELGMKVFLVTDHMLNKHDKDISVYPHGGFKELRDFILENV